MSAELVTAVFRLDGLDFPPGAKQTMKLILLRLAWRANEEGWAYLAQAEIAEAALVTDRRAQDHLKTLEGLGYLHRIRRGRGYSNGYQLNVRMITARSREQRGFQTLAARALDWADGGRDDGRSRPDTKVSDQE